MNRASLLVVPLVAALAACGSVVVVPIGPSADAAPTPDVAPTPDAVVPGDGGVTPPPPPVDVPPPLDVPPPDVAPPPPPGALARACQNFCQRGNAVCGTTADCAALCREALAQPGVVRCPAEALALITCGFSRNAFVCRPSRNTFELDTATCAGPSAAYERCANGTPPPPPPPVDGGMDPLRAVCARVCESMARACGTASSGCVDECVAVGSAPTYAMCSEQVIAAYECSVRAGFTCGPMGMAQPPRACASFFMAATDCLNGGVDPPPPPPVDGGPAPTYPGCAEACALADRACGMRDTTCVSGCSDAGSMLSGTCRRVFDEMLACVQRNGFTCRGGSPQPASACDALVMRLQMCGSGGSGGSGGGTPLVDAGAPDR